MEELLKTGALVLVEDTSGSMVESEVAPHVVSVKEPVMFAGHGESMSLGGRQVSHNDIVDVVNRPAL